VDTDRPDGGDVKPQFLKQVVSGTDYFAQVGRGPRLVAAVLLAPFAFYFMLAGLTTPVAAVAFAAKGEWPFAGVLLRIGAGHALAGLGLGWLTRRLWRGRPSANGVTVLPTWVVAVFLVTFLGPLSVGIAAVLAVGAYQAVNDGKFTEAVLWGAGAVGMLASVARGGRTIHQLTRPRAARGVTPLPGE
jgi:hypothetical protein